MAVKQHNRKDRLLKEEQHDAYFDKIKLTEPTYCTICGAVYSSGRWTWNTRTEDAKAAKCPACRRIADNYPAGVIELKGSFYKDHKTEITNLIMNTENQEKNKRPLERIMCTQEIGTYTEITTTGIHLARRIGEALSRSYKGNFSFQYADSDNSIRVFWER